MAKYKITDSQTGRSVVVSGEKPPTPADAEVIFQEAGLRPNPTSTPEGNAMTNFLPSLGRAAMGIVDAGKMAMTPATNDKGEFAGFSPVNNQLTQNVANMAVGAAEKLIPGQQNEEKYADAVGNFYKDRYGGVENIGNTVNQDPVGVLIDLSTLISAGGTIAAKAGQISKVSKLAKAGEVAKTAGAAIDPINAVIKTTGKVTQVATSPARKVGGVAADFLETEAKNLPLQGVRITPPQQLKFKKTHGLTVQDFVKDEKLSGNPVERAVEKADELQTSYDAVVKNSGIQVDGAKVIEGLNKRIAELKSGDNALNPPSLALAEKLEAYRDLYAGKLVGQPVGVDRLVGLRQQARKNMRSTKDFQVDPDTANVNVQLYRALNDVIYDAVGKSPKGTAQVRNLGKQLNRFYDFIELTEKTGMPATKSRLGEFVKGAGAATALTNPSMIPAILAGYGVKRLAANPTVLAGGAKALEGGARMAREAGTGVTGKMSAMMRALKRTNDAARESGVRLLPSPQQQR